MQAHGRAASFLNCPRCGLSIRPKVKLFTIEYCPRCIARARIPVRLFSSALPTVDLYADGSAPHVGARRTNPSVPIDSRE